MLFRLLTAMGSRLRLISYLWIWWLSTEAFLKTTSKLVLLKSQSRTSFTTRETTEQSCGSRSALKVRISLQEQSSSYSMLWMLSRSKLVNFGCATRRVFMVSTYQRLTLRWISKAASFLTPKIHLTTRYRMVFVKRFKRCFSTETLTSFLLISYQNSQSLKGATIGTRATNTQYLMEEVTRYLWWNSTTRLLTW